jgi:ribonuclease Z
LPGFLYYFMDIYCMLDVSLLGTGGVLPLPERFLSSLYCRSRIDGSCVLFDCGECTQVSLRLLGWSLKSLDVICITHFHADHVSGLPGILLGLGNCGRRDPIYILGPSGLREVVNGLCVIASNLPFRIVTIDDELLLGSGKCFYHKGYCINILPVEHTSNCLSYSLSVNRSGKFDPLRAMLLQIPKQYWSILQHGECVKYNGKYLLPEMVIGKHRKGIKISYCTDTRPSKHLEQFINGSDLFVCEGTYGDDNKLGKAIASKHMLFSEAAHLARAADVKELWLTHFSPSMPDPSCYLDVAKNIFTNTIIAYDRIHKTIAFDNSTTSN